MAQVLVRGLDEEVVARLKERAQRNGRSLSAELRKILTDTVPATRPREEVLADILKFRERFAGQTFSDSVDLIREDRER